MYIEGKIITFAILLRFFWLVYFEQNALTKSLAGLFIGAGMLYLVSFFYQTVRKRQGLGDGDAAVLGLIGFWLGWVDTFIIIFFSSLLSLIHWFILFFKTNKKDIELPFGSSISMITIIFYIIKETFKINTQIF